MTLRAGRLRHRVEIQSRASSQNTTTGVVTPAWSTFDTVWADIKPAAAQDFVSADVQTSKIAARIVIRYLAGVLPSMRVVHGSRVYQIEGVLGDPKYGNEFLTLQVREVVNG